MLLVMLAAAAAVPHSVTGAFGYLLGQATTPRIAACPYNTAGRTLFLCPGEGAFSRVTIFTRHNQVTAINASRAYKGKPLDVALRTCRADLGPLKRMVRRNYPGLIDLPLYNDGSFWLSEEALGGRVPIGRSILGRCSESGNARFGKAITLWFTYQLSTRETVRLVEFDKAAAGTK
jgi:hypothetical protein